MEPSKTSSLLPDVAQARVVEVEVKDSDTEASVIGGPMYGAADVRSNITKH